MHLTLIVLNGPGKGQVFRLEDDQPEVIGRQVPRLKLRDSEVSRHHAEIRCENDTWLIRDLGSTNGTYVNGRRIETITELEEGDQVLVGRVLLVVAQIVAEEELQTHEPDEPAPRAAEPSVQAAAPPSPRPVPPPDDEDEDDFLAGPLASTRIDEDDDAFDFDAAPPAPPEAPEASETPAPAARWEPEPEEEELEVAGGDAAALDAPSGPVAQAEPVSEPEPELELELEHEEGLDLFAEEPSAPQVTTSATPAPDLGPEGEDEEPIELEFGTEREPESQPGPTFELESSDSAATPELPAPAPPREREPQPAVSLDQDEDEDEVLRQLAALAEEDEEADTFADEPSDDELDALAELRRLGEEKEAPREVAEEEPDSLFGSQVEKTLQTPFISDVDDLLADDEPIVPEATGEASEPSATPPTPPAIDAESAAAPSPLEVDDAEDLEEALDLPDDEDLEPDAGTGLLHHVGLSENISDGSDTEPLLAISPADGGDESQPSIDGDAADEDLLLAAGPESPIDDLSEDREEEGVNLAAFAPEQPQAEQPTTHIAEAVQTHVPYDSLEAGLPGAAGRSGGTPARDEVDAPERLDRDESHDDDRPAGPGKGAITVLLSALVLSGAAVGAWYALDSRPSDRSSGVRSPAESASPVASLPAPRVPPSPEAPTPSSATPTDPRQRLLRELAAAVPPESASDALEDGPVLLGEAVLKQRVARATGSPAAPVPAAIPAPPNLPPAAAEPVVTPPPVTKPQPEPAVAVAEAEAPAVAPEPPRERQPAAVPMRRVAYLVDASGSLIDTLGLVIEWLDGELQGMDPDTDFTVMFFRDGEAIEAPPAGLRRASGAAVTATSRWMEPAEGNILPSGKSDPTRALQRAIGYGVDEVVILSDDSISSRMSQEKIDAMMGELDGLLAGQEVRIHTVQFFYRDPMRVLEGLAERYQGTYRFIQPEQQGGPDPMEALSNVSAVPLRDPATP